MSDDTTADLSESATEGNPDFVVDQEVKSVDHGVWAARLGNDQKRFEDARQEVDRRYQDFRSHVIRRGLDEDSLLSGVEKFYSTSMAAAFFGRCTHWIYWGLRENPKTGICPFSYKDGTPILPERINAIGKRRFSLPIIREIALSCYRRGNMTDDELEMIMKKILLAEFGEHSFSNVV